MGKPFQISVTIPVYNTADFVEQAVESALIQPQTEEVILVEDASSDNSLDVCQKLAAVNKRVHLFHHPDGGKHGCSASRSLAVQKSTCEYIAFLERMISFCQVDSILLNRCFQTTQNWTEYMKRSVCRWKMKPASSVGRMRNEH